MRVKSVLPNNVFVTRFHNVGPAIKIVLSSLKRVFFLNKKKSFFPSYICTIFCLAPFLKIFYFVNLFICTINSIHVISTNSKDL